MENKEVVKGGDVKETPEELKFWRDKFVLETKFPKGTPNKITSVQALGVTPENYDKIVGVETNPAKVFLPKGQAEMFSEMQPLFYDRVGLFWLWNNEKKFWEKSDEVDILNMIVDTTQKDVISSKNRTEIINSLKQEGRRNMPKPIKKTWVQFKDKIYDIETGIFFEATPKYFVTNPIPHEVSHLPNTPTMDRIFEEWVGKDYVETLYEILAYSLLPDYPLAKIFVLIGGGRNGKSKFLELLKRFIGVENICSTELDTLMNSRFEVSKLHKKLACLMGETNFNEMSKTSELKKLSGGDLIGFEIKNKTPFDDINYAKIIMATNNLPTTSDKTIGFYSRWMIIDFPNRFSELKDILADIPDKEYSNLATRCLVTLSGLLSSRKFTNEGTYEDRMEKFEAKSDFLQKFLDDFVDLEAINDFITKSQFRKKFDDWCVENRHRKISDVVMGKKMKDKGVEGGKKHMNWMYDGRGGDARVWFDIKWKDG